MRAGLEALSDKSLPSLVADAEGEVAAACKGICNSLAGNWRRSALPKYPTKRARGAGLAPDGIRGTVNACLLAGNSFFRHFAAGQPMAAVPTKLCACFSRA